jgi:hypothetical protein
VERSAKESTLKSRKEREREREREREKENERGKRERESVISRLWKTKRLKNNKSFES